MPKKTFHLNAEKTDSVDISWGYSWKNTTVRYQGDEIGTFKDQKELKKGKEFALDDSRMLGVKLSGILHMALDISINGEAVEGSPTHPANQLKQASGLAIVLGVFGMVLGIIAELYEVKVLSDLGVGRANVLLGAVIIGLAIGVRKKSYIALSLLILMCILGIIETVYFAATSEVFVNPTNGVLIKGLLLVYLFRSFSAIKKLKKKDAENKTENA